MHFAFLAQPQVTRKSTVGNVNHDCKTKLFVSQESKPLPSAGLWLGVGRAATLWGLHFWWDKLVTVVQQLH